jgi:hypothetical protein
VMLPAWLMLSLCGADKDATASSLGESSPPSN